MPNRPGSAAALAYAGPNAAGPTVPKPGAWPGLLIGQTRELSAGVEGNATLEELREFLLGVPGLPPDTVRQLRAIGDWRNTVPIFVDDPVNAQQTRIGGGEGLLIKSNAGDCCDAVWQRDGRIYAVRLRGVAVDEAQVRRLADSLR